MNPQTINAMEIVMLTIFVVLRIAGTCFIVWALATSGITVGYKTILIALALLVGLGFGLKYSNPNAPCDPQHSHFQGKQGMKAKKKRTKKYNSKRHRIGYLDMLDISANKGLSDRAAASIELDYRIHLQSFRTEPSHESWAYLVGLLLLADRLSYDLEEGEEFRREIEPAWRQVDAAWRIWQEKHVIAQENLLQAEALLQSLIELFKGFTYKEMDQALHYVMKHHLKPVRVMKEEGLIE